MALKNTILIITSLLFYAYGEPIFIFLVFVSTIANYLFGLAVDNQRQGFRKVMLVLSIVFNVGLLIVFKYTDMILSSVNSIFRMDLPMANIALPIGISFYTFQAISYVVDVYRGLSKSQKNYFNVLLYISFFPQKIAGPIIKYKDIEHELTKRKVTAAGAADGMRRFVVGLSKKVLIANTMALVADGVFDAPLSQVNAPAAWIGAIAYMMQIYFDFSGYSDMAIGLGKLFGFHFVENFNYPYHATSIQDFWHKWHMTLSQWFKDYVYIPLGGNRKGRIRTNINKVIVFFITGLWHGAAWNFVIWGLVHGALLLLEDVLPIKKLPVIIKRAYTLLMVCLTFVLFRAETLTGGFGIIGRMFAGWSFAASEVSLFARQMTPLFMVTLLVAILTCVPHHIKLYRNLINNPRYGKAALHISYICSYGLLLVCLLTLSSGAYNPFIYFRF
ncbi:MAG: MBOAT family protein [Lachnospiraceae bacterium]|nr:MBOAT family protein [Lachnospiraceae bacterium]